MFIAVKNLWISLWQKVKQSSAVRIGKHWRIHHPLNTTGYVRIYKCVRARLFVVQIWKV